MFPPEWTLKAWRKRIAVSDMGELMEEHDPESFPVPSGRLHRQEDSGSQNAMCKRHGDALAHLDLH